MDFVFWQEKAYEESEKYKEGMYILERERMLKEGWWLYLQADLQNWYIISIKRYNL